MVATVPWNNNKPLYRRHFWAMYDSIPVPELSDETIRSDGGRLKNAGVPLAKLESSLSISRDCVKKEIAKQVIRKKLAKQRHLVVKEAINPAYLDTLFPRLLEMFEPQTVMYNGGLANIKEWKISCYLEVLQGGIPCTNPNLGLLDLFTPLLNTCNDLFTHWYLQQHSCNGRNSTKKIRVRRLMTFVTRYRPNPKEAALLKHVDGAGKVDGSAVVALPIDRWSAPEHVNRFHGGGLTCWDGKDASTGMPLETHYDTRSGDMAFLDRAVWHQADPITKGSRWALVVFYAVDKLV